MLKKTLISLGLLAMTTLTSGCVVYARPHAVVYGPEPVVYSPAVVVDPVFGFYGGYGYGWRGEGGWHHGGGHWR